jgi:hypothetical protein
VSLLREQANLRGEIVGSFQLPSSVDAAGGAEGQAHVLGTPE